MYARLAMPQTIAIADRLSALLSRTLRKEPAASATQTG